MLTSVPFFLKLKTGLDCFVHPAFKLHNDTLIGRDFADEVQVCDLFCLEFSPTVSSSTEIGGGIRNLSKKSV